MSRYNYLLAPDMPKMIQEAMKLYGTKEIPGAKHNQTILAWGDAVGVGDKVNDDEQAWCGLFVAYCAVRAQKFIPMKGWDILRALKWKEFGKAVSTPGLGDVLVFTRKGGGHVGIYVGEDKSNYYVLGGNQGNQVSIVPIAKNRLAKDGIRRPIYTNQPSSVRQVFLTAEGIASTDES